MKCMVIGYIKSELLLQDLEGAMEYRKFNQVESNYCYRVFAGHVYGRVHDLAESLNKELADAVFDIEDSLFIIYPTITTSGFSSMASIVIKRKGNKHLRAHTVHK